MPDLVHPARRQEKALGGNVSAAVRVGDTVRRRAMAATPTVHALLRHLVRKGFNRAPRPHGLDDRGREMLSYLPGKTWSYPWRMDHLRPPVLAGVARLLRRYHDATVGFSAPAGAIWSGPVLEPAEVVCHNDVGPYNVVFRRGRPYGLIDFDGAAPGPRVWDVCFAAYRFSGLCDVSARPRDAETLALIAGRFRAFCAAYGSVTPEAAWATLPTRLHYQAAWLRAPEGEDGETRARLVRDGHADFFDRERAALEGLKELFPCIHHLAR